MRTTELRSAVPGTREVRVWLCSPWPAAQRHRPARRGMFEVEVSSMSPERFRAVLAPDRYEQFESGVQYARELLAGRVVWNVNSTARGGGVAELLESLVPYARGSDVDARWMVIEAPDEF